MISERVFFFGAFLILSSCCEDHRKFPPVEEEGADIVGVWRALSPKRDVVLSLDQSGNFFCTDGEIEIRGAYRAIGKSFNHDYEDCLTYDFEWVDEVDESDPFDDGRSHFIGRLGREGVLWLDFGAKIPLGVFIQE